MTTSKEVKKAFWDNVKTDRKLLRQKNKRDAFGMHTSDIRNAFVEYIEQKRSAGQISDELANTITL